MTKEEIRKISPVLNYLRSLGITNKFIEENITYNPNTKYFLTYFKEVGLNIPKSVQESSGIYIKDVPDDKVIIHKIYDVYITEKA